MMACHKKKNVPANSPIIEVRSFPGELGFLNVTSRSDETETVTGQVTGINYTFEPYQEKFVDKRDAIFILGGEFEISD